MDREQIIGATRGGVIVCIVAGAEDELLDRCLESVLRHAGEEVPIVLAGDSTAELRESVDGRRAIHRRAGVVEALADAAPADVVLLAAGSVVADGWLEGLRAAAWIDGRVATASAMTTPGGFACVSLPERSRFEDAAAAIRADSPLMRPRLNAAAPPCVYIRRTALELVGAFDNLDRFSRHCLHSGLAHVLADDVLVYADGGPPPETEPGGRVARSLGAARRSVQGLSIVVDARNLGPRMDGTKLHVLELIAAVARPGAERVHALVSEKLDAEARELLEALPGVEPTIFTSESARRLRADVVHRPSQIDSPADLALLAQLADRLVITQQDLIGYQNPSYFASPEAWHGYRALTRDAIAMADRVLFFSAYARDEALAEDLITRDRASLVHIGVDHAVTRAFADEPVAPRGARALPADAEVAVCIGTDYGHKNRVFAIHLVAELRRTHDWRGRLLLAGARVPFGSSAQAEAQLLDADPDLREIVIDVGEVTEPEKHWLLRRAQVVLYPTVYEGFGLVPFEAADHGVPCLWAPGTALSELLPDSSAGIVPWEASVSADRALALIRDESERQRNLEALREAAAGLRWAAAGERLLEVYRETCDAPPSPASSYERRGGLMRGGFSEDAVRLVGPNGLLPRALERPLLALASHPKLARPVFGAIEAGYRVSKRHRTPGR